MENNFRNGKRMIAYLLSIKESDCFPDEKWDFGFLKEAFDKNKIETIRTRSLPECDKAFVVIAGYENHQIIDRVSTELKKIKKVILFITADELGLFHPELLEHDDIKVWVQSPYQHHESFFRMPIGCPSHMKQNLPDYTEKFYDVFFSGQITHQRRQDVATYMPGIENSLFNPTAGFTQGYSPKEYYKHLAEARISPSPAGTATIDSFRLYEAIEMLSIPIGDVVNSKGEPFDFWNFVFYDNFPAPTISEWSSLNDLKEEILKDYPANLHKIVSWWIKYKRDFANKIMEQIYEH